MTERGGDVERLAASPDIPAAIVAYLDWKARGDSSPANLVHAILAAARGSVGEPAPIKAGDVVRAEFCNGAWRFFVNGEPRTVAPHDGDLAAFAYAIAQRDDWSGLALGEPAPKYECKAKAFLGATAEHKQHECCRDSGHPERHLCVCGHEWGAGEAYGLRGGEPAAPSEPDEWPKMPPLAFNKQQEAILIKPAITFAELVAFGILSGAPLYNGMPWSFDYKGHPITHETDDQYLLPGVDAEGRSIKFNRGDVLHSDLVADGDDCRIALRVVRGVEPSASPEQET